MAAGDIWSVDNLNTGIYKSIDNGVTRTKVTDGPPGYSSYSGIGVEISTRNLYLLTITQPAIHVFDGTSQTWNEPISVASFQQLPTGLAVDGRNEDLWIIGASPSRLHKSTNRGITFGPPIQVQSNVNDILTGVSIDERNGDLYVSISNNKIQKSSDGGITWVSVPVPSSLGSESSIGDISIDGMNGNLWICSSSNLFTSNDNGANWVKISLIRASYAGIYIEPGGADAIPPAIENAATVLDGTIIRLFYNETLDETHVPPPSSFTVNRSNSVSSVSISGSSVVINFSTPFAYNDNVLISYTVPALNDDKIQDLAGNYSKSFMNRSVRNLTISLAERIITITASSDIETSKFYIPWAGDADDFSPVPFWESGAGTATDPYIVDRRVFYTETEISHSFINGYSHLGHDNIRASYQISFPHRATLLFFESFVGMTSDIDIFVYDGSNKVAQRPSSGGITSRRLGYDVEANKPYTIYVTRSRDLTNVITLKLVYLVLIDPVPVTDNIVDKPEGLLVTNDAISADSTERIYYTTFEYSSSSTFTNPRRVYDVNLDQYHYSVISTSTSLQYYRARFTRGSTDTGVKGPWSSTVEYRNVSSVGTPVSHLPVVSISSSTISGPSNVQTGETNTWTLSIRGVYDAIRGSLTATRTYTLTGQPNVIISVTAVGLGIKARRGSSRIVRKLKTITVTEEASTTTPPPVTVTLPPASVSVTLSRVGSASKVVGTARGTYDTLSWSPTPNSSSGNSATWNIRPGSFRATATVTGTGTKASDGTTATDSDSVRSRIDIVGHR